MGLTVDLMTASGWFLWCDCGWGTGRNCAGEDWKEEVLGAGRLVLQVHHSQDPGGRIPGVPLLPLAGGRQGSGAQRWTRYIDLCGGPVIGRSTWSKVTAIYINISFILAISLMLRTIKSKHLFEMVEEIIIFPLLVVDTIQYITFLNSTKTVQLKKLSVF